MNNLRQTLLRTILVVAVAAPALYLAVMLFHFANRPYITETAVTATMTDSLYCEGAVVFSEQTLPAGSGEIGYLVADGIRVSAGTQVAEQYTDAAQAQCRKQLQQVQEEIQVLQSSQVSGNVDTLSASMRTATLDILDALAAHDFGQASSGAQEYLLASNRLKVTTGQSAGFADTLAELNAQKDALTQQLGSPAAVTAPSGGYFISSDKASFLSVDGETLAGMTASELSAALETGILQSADAYSGKIVTSYTWHFYGVCTLEESEKFTVGSKVSVSFPNRSDTVLPAKVLSLEEEEGTGLVKVTLECEYMGADILALGQETARIDFASYEGIRVPAQALHIVDGQKCVYVKYGNLARKRNIVVLYEDENYLLVPADGKVGGDSEVRLYDEVIVSGMDLYDGKKL